MNDSADSPSPAVGPEPNWRTTELLLQTLNQELGALKEYVLTELRGEIASLRSEKIQLQSEVQELQHQQENLLSDRQQQQQHQWAEQFAQVLAQNLRQQLQAQVLGLTESDGVSLHPEQQLLRLQQQMADLETALTPVLNQVTDTVQAALQSHQGDLRQQLLRMQDLEQQGEMLLGQLVQHLRQTQETVEPAEGERTLETARLPSHPTDVASVMAAMANLQPPTSTAKPAPKTALETDVPSTAAAAASPRPFWEMDGGDGLVLPKTSPDPPPLDPPPDNSSLESLSESTPLDFPHLETSSPSGSNSSQGIATTRPAMRPATPRLTTPVAATPSPRPPDSDAASDAAMEAAMEAAMDEGPDESFLAIADFPMEVLKPGFPQGSGSAATPDSPRPGGAPIPAWPQEPPTTVTSLRALIYPQEQAVSEPVPSAQPQPIGLMGSQLPSQLPPLSQGAAAQQGLGGMRDRRSLAPPRPRASSWLIASLGLLLLSLQWLTLQVLFHGAPWLAIGPAGLIAPSWSSALVTFWIRMLMLLPFLVVVGQGLYPPLMEEMQRVISDRDRAPLLSIAASGLFLFLGHFLLYGAIGTTSVTLAIALFFSYPLISQALGWGLFGQPLGPYRWGAMILLALGLLTIGVQGGSGGGAIAALAGGLCFALYQMLASFNRRRVSGLTLTILQCVLAWVFSMPALVFLPQIQPHHELGYVVACLLLSLTVLFSYFFERASLVRLGSSWSAAVMGGVPLLVGLGGLVLTSERLTPAQGIGVILVSVGAIALGWLRRGR